MTSRRGSPGIAGRPAGFSTFGMIVSLVLLGFVLVPLLGTVLAAQRGFVESRQRARAARSIRYAHLSLTRFMRIAGSSPVAGPVDGIEPDPDGNGVFDDVRLRADYNPPDGDTGDAGEDLTFFLRGDTMLVRTEPDGEEEPYLIGVDSLAFEYFNRHGDPITDPGRVAQRALSARVLIRGRGQTADPAFRTLSGQVRLRNRR